MSDRQQSFGLETGAANALSDLALLQTEEERRRSAEIARYGCAGVDASSEDAVITARSVKLTTGGGLWDVLLGVKR